MQSFDISHFFASQGIILIGIIEQVFIHLSAVIKTIKNHQQAAFFYEA